MTDKDMPADDRATRRRGAALEGAILGAALDELRAGGYAALTIDRVARRAATNKNAIYRRWPNRAALGLAAYRHLLVACTPPPPDTCTLRDDALALLRGANGHLASPAGDLLRGLLVGAADDPDFLAQLREAALDAGSDLWLRVLGRAVARGELSPEALHPRVATVAIALLRNEFVVRGASTVPDSVLVDIIDEVYLPLLHGRSSRPASSRT